MHPHHEHRAHKVEHRRVGHITRGYASGGAVHRHDDAAEDKKLIKKVLKERDAQAVSGRPAKERADRPHRAKGGRVGKHKGTNVNVIVAGGAHPGMAPPPAMAAGAPASMPPPRPPMPPMAPPPGGPPMAGPGMPPPGMPPRHAGGRTYARGGGIKSGPTWEEGKKNGTPVQHTNNKGDGKNIGRGRVVTFRTGGAVEGPRTGGMGPKLPGGAGGGEARLAKEKRAERSYKRA